jgi:hypothetical protein
MAEGQRAALGVHAAISGETVALPDWTRTDYDRSTALRDGIVKAKRRKVPHIAIGRRSSSFAEVEARYREKDAIAEAARCLQCGICCECGACVAACGEARAIDHAGTAKTIALPLLAAIRTDAAETVEPVPEICSSTTRHRTQSPCSIGCETTLTQCSRCGAGQSLAHPGSTSIFAHATIPSTTGT